MSALETAVILTIATTTVLLIYTPVAYGQQAKKHSGASQNVSYIDPKGGDVQFVLFTKKNKFHHLKIGDGAGFNNSQFNVSLPTKIIIHGFASSINDNIFTLNRDAYLEAGDYNVIGMDWSVLCDFEYLSAIRNAQVASTFLADFVNWIIIMGVRHDDIHLIGHSLGAHVAGMGGHKIKGGKIGRITGLDPAGPGYNNIPPQNRLDPDDAKTVDVIHTYMKVLSLGQPLGDVDFYPNGGKFQPGCPDLCDIWKMAESLICNHARAYIYFAESIRNKKAFKAKRCPSLNAALENHCSEDTDVYMGQAETYKNGLYYVKTKATPPFSYT